MSLKLNWKMNKAWKPIYS